MLNSDNDPAAERAAFTIAEFCRRNGISEPTYFKLRDLGRGPKEMRLGAAVRISSAAESAWQRARENPKGEEAEAVRKAQDDLRKRSHAAASRSIESPRHISTRRRA
jgi:predicted DNA-binding transcriptional regulator AlpA